DNPLQVPFAMTNTDAAMATLNILKTNGNGFTDSQTTDPHQQNQGAVSPRRKLCKEGTQVLVSNDIGKSLGLLAIQSLAVSTCLSISLKGKNWITRKMIGIDEIEFRKQRGDSSKTPVNRKTGQSCLVL